MASNNTGSEPLFSAGTAVVSPTSPTIRCKHHRVPNLTETVERRFGRDDLSVDDLELVIQGLPLVGDAQREHPKHLETLHV